MTFYVDDTTITESVQLSSIDTTNQVNSLSYTPVWLYNSTDALSPGTMTTEPSTGYKTVNIIDANGINIEYWISTLKAIITTKNNVPGFLNNIYITYVDTNNNFVVTGISSITNNENDTYTIGDGDLYTVGDLFVDNNKIYASFLTK